MQNKNLIIITGDNPRFSGFVFAEYDLLQQLLYESAHI